MKYIVEISENKMTRTFVDDNGKEYKEEWQVKDEGNPRTIGVSIDELMDEEGTFDDDLVCAIEGGDVHDIWEAIRNQ